MQRGTSLALHCVCGGGRHAWDSWIVSSVVKENVAAEPANTLQFHQRGLLSWPTYRAAPLWG